MINEIVNTIKEFFLKNKLNEKDGRSPEEQKENLRGLELFKNNPKEAILIFSALYDRTAKGTLFSTELMENMGKCYLKRAKQASCPLKQYIYRSRATEYFDKAKEEYPGNKKEYEKKIKNISKNYA